MTQPLTPPVRFQEVAALLKVLLKQRGLSYRDLAVHLRLSESSVKKMFIAEDCSLERLGDICTLLGTTLTDVLISLQEAPVQVHRHSPEQEKFLVENPRALNVYFKLVCEEIAPEEVRLVFGLSQAAFFKILRSLDRYDLIQLMPNGEVKFRDMNMVLWENAGPLVAKMKREWPLRLLDMVNSAGEAPGYRLSLRIYRMKPATLRDFIQAFSDLEIEFARRAQREDRLQHSETIPVAMMAAFAPRSFVERL